VRARLISTQKTMSWRNRCDTLQIAFLNTGCSKSHAAIDLETIVGLEFSPFAVLFHPHAFLRIRMNFLGAVCSAMPADWQQKNEGAPHCHRIMGTSGALQIYIQIYRYPDR